MYEKKSYLCDDSKLIREEVFMQEQGFENEFDEIDDLATHIVFYDSTVPIATCRYYKGKNNEEYIVGRIAIRKCYRGKHLGNLMMNVLKENIVSEGGKLITLSAQLQAKQFYEKNGYIAIGEPYLDEDCLHVHMEKSLKGEY
ncbi:MAG: family N-acetyltransferase [Anaerocolumna sp.]|jgi:predicted GNAT family N-acyltransferase|nr:family N-acetyltransferase [Anaerocolumna sp.]